MTMFDNILVTGGAGFVGSQLVKKLIPICNHIYVIDNLSTGNHQAVPSAKNITFIEGSILDDKLLKDILPKISVIFHLACRNLLLSVGDVEEDLKQNLLGGFRLLQCTKEYCPNLQRFIYTSTASVYGNSETIPTPEKNYSISLPYSASKFGVEHYCSVFYNLYQLPISILRLSNVYGPGQSPTNPYCGVIAKFFNQIKLSKPIKIHGDGTQTRDFTYIEDVLDALLLAASHPKAVGEIFNVGTGIETSINQLAQMIIEVCDHQDTPLHHKSKRVIDKIYRRAVDVNKIESHLNWTPNYSLYEGLVRTANWYFNTNG
jgi:UDP-glucose 4-epimerase